MSDSKVRYSQTKSLPCHLVHRTSPLPIVLKVFHSLSPTQYFECPISCPLALPYAMNLIQQLSFNFAIFIPIHIAHDTLVPSCMSTPLASNVKWHPEHQYSSVNSCHGAIGADISRFLNPRVCVERKEEAERRFEGHRSKHHVARNRTITIDGINQRNISGLHYREVE